MLLDREQFLTGALAQAFTPTSGNATYGTSEYDLKDAGNAAAVGEPLAAYVIPTVDAAGPTNVIISIEQADDAAGTNAVELCTRTFVVGTDLLTTVGVQKIGICNTRAVGAAGQYLLAKVLADDANMTGGTLRIWLQKSDMDAYPHNAAVKL